MPKLNLTYLQRVSINHESSGLDEPSGAVLAQDKKGLWVISDNKKRIFQIDFDGNLKPDITIRTDDKQLEGITLDEKGNLFVVSEGKNKIIVFDDQGNLKQEQKLENIPGYDQVAQYFNQPDMENKGLEGITVSNNDLFCLKEGYPGLLIKISLDLQKIIEFKILDKNNNFLDDEIESSKIDYSGICYDSLRDCFWIVSDKAKRLFLYSWLNNQVIVSFPLDYEENGNKKQIQKAEGVAYDPKNQKLYIVSDREARLYIYQVKED